MSSIPTTAKAPLRVGLLGAGVIAAPHVLALRSTPGTQLVAICDRDRTKADLFQRQWQVPQAYDDLGQMLMGGVLDVVHVLLPPSAHADLAIQCLRANCDVFIEKPFTLSVADCQRVTAVAERFGRTVGVNHNLTYMPGVLRMIEALKDYRIGAVEHVTVVYNLPMPALAAGQHAHWMFGETERLILELAPHPLSVVCRLLGGVQEAATAASGRTVLRNGKTFFDTWQSSLVCDRGTAQLCLSVGRDYLNTWVHVLGQDGEVFVDLRRNTMRLSEKTRYPRMDNLLDSWWNAKGTVGASLNNFVRTARGALGLGPVFELQNLSMNASIGAYYAAIRAGRRVPVGAEEGTAVVHACESIVQSVADMPAVGERS